MHRLVLFTCLVLIFRPTAPSSLQESPPWEKLSANIPRQDNTTCVLIMILHFSWSDTILHAVPNLYILIYAILSLKPNVFVTKFLNSCRVLPVTYAFHIFFFYIFFHQTSVEVDASDHGIKEHMGSMKAMGQRSQNVKGTSHKVFSKDKRQRDDLHFPRDKRSNRQ